MFRPMDANVRVAGRADIDEAERDARRGPLANAHAPRRGTRLVLR